jgi:glycosyltransferase involved in cell wall biosynthesis
LWRAWLHFDAPAIDQLIGGVDLFHSPSGHVPPLQSGASVTTIHDLFFLTNPQDCHSLGGQYLLRRLPEKMHSLARIITPTEAVRRQVIARYALDDERVAAIHHGIDLERFRPESMDADDAVLRRLQLPERFILFVGTREPRKNLPMLIEAHDRLRRKNGEVPPLVIAGGKGWGDQSVTLTSGLHFTGIVPDEDLPALYRKCEFLVLPSLDEGFGLPVLEAMACGAPVLCSDLPSLREVCEDAALFCPVGDVAALERGTENLLDDPGQRDAMRTKGLSRAEQFCWNSAADATANVYRMAIEECRQKGNCVDHSAK